MIPERLAPSAPRASASSTTASDATDRTRWENLGERPEPSWYLDRLTAQQKRDAHLRLISRWTAGLAVERILKTDLFEEAFGEDRLLPELFPDALLACGMDEALSTVRAAARRFPRLAGRATVTDVRQCGLKSQAFDLVLSTSTLDHFERREEFLRSLREIGRLLRPGGLLILTLDNPSNPLYHPLKWISRTSIAPFRLGYSPSMPTLRTDLGEAGLRIEAEDWLVHNPRLLSTAVFLVLRRLLGSGADTPIAALLRTFDRLGQLPTRRWTACFQAVAARKSDAPELR
jgi:SAM-dependent methyltransferase